MSLVIVLQDPDTGREWTLGALVINSQERTSESRPEPESVPKPTIDLTAEDMRLNMFPKVPAMTGIRVKMVGDGSWRACWYSYLEHRSRTLTARWNTGAPIHFTTSDEAYAWLAANYTAIVTDRYEGERARSPRSFVK